MENLKDLIYKAESSGDYQYRVMKREYKENLYDLFIQIDASCYRIASYNAKNKRLIIPFPDLYIPRRETLHGFINIVEEESEVLKDEK